MTDPAETAQSAQPPQVITRTIIERERVISKFYGDDPSECAQFEEEIRRAWSISPRDKRHQMDILKTNVGPLVRAEIACMEEDKKGDPESVLKMILARFGEARSTNELLQVLVAITRRPNERVMEFSHRCKAAFTDLTARQKALGESVFQEALLINHFVRNIADRSLTKHLREKLSANPEWSFAKIREAALTWAADDEVEGTSGSAAVNSSQLATEQGSTSSRLESMMMAMLERMDALLQKKEAHQEQKEPQNRRRRGLCYRCHKPGHFARDCTQAGN